MQREPDLNDQGRPLRQSLPSSELQRRNTAIKFDLERVATDGGNANFRNFSRHSSSHHLSTDSGDSYTLVDGLYLPSLAQLPVRKEKARGQTTIEGTLFLPLIARVVP